MQPQLHGRGVSQRPGARGRPGRQSSATDLGRADLLGRKLTDPRREVPGAVRARASAGIVLLPHRFTWLPWMQSAGGSPIVQIRRSPRRDRTTSSWPKRPGFVTPDARTWSGSASLARQLRVARGRGRGRPLPPPALGKVADRSADPRAGHPDRRDVAQRWVAVGERRVTFTDAGGRHGVARITSEQRGDGMWELLGRGEVAMVTWLSRI